MLIIKNNLNTKTSTVGFEPTLPERSGFQDHRLNHSATLTSLKDEKIFN